MKRLVGLSAFVLLLTAYEVAKAQIFWGPNELFFYTKIAERHISPVATANIYHHLGVDISEASFRIIDNKHPASESNQYHRIIVSAKLDYEDFIQAAQNMKQENLYRRIYYLIDILRLNKVRYNGQYSWDFELKELIHLIGDAHRPDMVTLYNTKDKSIKNMSYEDNIWEKIPRNQSKHSVLELATKYDQFGGRTIKRLQTDSVMKWLFESYKLRQYIDKLSGDKDRLTSEDTVMIRSIYQKRFAVAGVRLAGVLNSIYKDQQRDDPTEKYHFVKAFLRTDEAVEKIYGNKITLEGRVISYTKNDSATILRLKYDDVAKPITVILKGAALIQKDDILKGGSVFVTGKIERVHHKPTIVITERNKIVANRIYIE